MKCEHLFIGKKSSFKFYGKEVISGILKKGVDEIRIEKSGVQKDEQADLKHHGGVDKAICVYPLAHYVFWNHLYKVNTFGPSSFGENITLSGATEKDIYIGDIYAIGSALVQVSQIRVPCYKLDMRNKVLQLPLYVRKYGYTGFYLRVIKSGTIIVKDPWALISRENDSISLEELAHLQFSNTENKDKVAQLLKSNSLAEAAKNDLKKLLKK